jgi:ribosomal 50S subunit-recycling heat shock protein
MKCLSKWLSASAVVVLLAGTAAAADSISRGKIKAVNADKTESKSDLAVGDVVNIFYDKGATTSTARYVLVQDGDTKNFELMYGSVKSYDADKKGLAFTDGAGKEWTFTLGDAKVRLNKQDAKIGDVKIGDKALVIVDRTGDKSTLKCVMAEHK